MVHIRYIDNSNDFEFCRYASACRHRKEFQMQFGHFDDQQREYVITDPRTPLPWINYLGSEDFSRSCPTRQAATASIATRGCAV